MQLLPRCQLGKGEEIRCSWEPEDSVKTKLTKGIILSSNTFLPGLDLIQLVTLTKSWVPHNISKDTDRHPHLTKGQQGLDMPVFFKVFQVCKARLCYQHNWGGSPCGTIT